MQKKGQVTISNGPALVLAIGLAILIAGAMAIALNSFKQTQCTGTWSAGECYSGPDLLNRTGSYAANISYMGEQALDNWSAQIGTVGTVLGIAMIITVIVGAFALFGRKGGGL